MNKLKKLKIFHKFRKNQRSFQKKGFSLSLGTVLTLVILTIFAVIIVAIFFLPNSLLPEIAETVRGFERFLPGKSQEDIPLGRGAPEDITKIFDSLYNKFIESRDKEDCYVKYTPLKMGKYTIELEYIEAEKGLHMRLLNEKLQLTSNHFVNGVKPCIALPDKKDDNKIAKVSPLTKSKIKKNNELHYGGEEYNMFKNYPILYKPEGKNLVCFFTDDTVIDPADGKTVYGDTKLNDGFDNGDMKKRMNKLCK